MAYAGMMPRRTGHLRLSGVACCLVLFASASDGGEAGMDKGSTSRSRKQDSLLLDLANREIVQPIGSELAEPARQKYVRVQITDVHNPRELRLTFEVRYRLHGGKEVLLGTFALFPPDNPGNFIVATRGELRKEGAVVLSMKVLDEVEPGDEVRLAVKPLSFLEE